MLADLPARLEAAFARSAGHGLLQLAAAARSGGRGPCDDELRHAREDPRAPHDSAASSGAGRGAGNGALSIACHPHHRTTRRIEISTCYLWDHRTELADLVDVWEATNRDDLFSVTSLKHYPYVANSDFHKPRHLYSWKTLVRSVKAWPDIRHALRANVDIALTLYRKEPCVG
jgi:hypothetical protein